MIEDVLLCFFATVMYWGICQFFATYNHKCLSRRLYVNVPNKYIWLLLGGRYQGREKTPEEDWYKLSILGIATYIALLPVLLAFYAAIFALYTFDDYSGMALAIYTSFIVLVNIFDDILGKIFFR